MPRTHGLPANIDSGVSPRSLLPPDAWRALFARILASVGLPAHDLAPFATGSDVVWGTPTHVVKLTAPRWAAEIAAEAQILRTVKPHLGDLTADAVATGEIEGWPWVVQTRLPGTAVADLLPTLAADQRASVARQIGALVARLHAIPAAPDPGWDAFLAAARARAPKRDAGCGPVWADGVAGFLASVPLTTEPPVLLHTEIYDQHVLVDADTLTVCGLIDFADGRVGHPLYETAAVHELMFKGDAAAMAAFWEGWGRPRPTPREQLAWALSHRFGRLDRHLAIAGDGVAPGDFEALAVALHG